MTCPHRHADNCNLGNGLIADLARCPTTPAACAYCVTKADPPRGLNEVTASLALTAAAKQRLEVPDETRAQLSRHLRRIDRRTGSTSIEPMFAAATSEATSQPSPAADYFPNVYVISLARRPQRLEDFYRRIDAVDWPFKRPEHIHAIDGTKCPAPPDWTAGNPAWGCYRTHLRIIEDLANGTIDGPALIFEDDAEPLGPDFAERLAAFLADVPPKWDMIYLGGQHLDRNIAPPDKITCQVLRAYNVNRTHAYAVHPRFARQLYEHLTRPDWEKGHHIDHHYGRIHRTARTYCPTAWLFGQAAGYSDIAAKEQPRRTWTNPRTSPFLAVIGTHRSGSSALATALHKMGIHMGNKLIGYERTGGGEAAGLANICERAYAFPATAPTAELDDIAIELRQWVNARRTEADKRGTIAGGKYPTLAALIPRLGQIVAPGPLYLLWIRRPIDESIESLKRRSRRSTGWLHITDDQAEAVQRWLYTACEIAVQHHTNSLTVEYDQLLARPAGTLDRIAHWLQFHPEPEARNAAIAHIDPAQRHVHRNTTEPLGVPT